MKFISTRPGSEAVSFSAAAEIGLAPNGGLYVPVKFPEITVSHFSSLANQLNIGLFAGKLLSYFLVDDPMQARIESVAQNALNFPVPLKILKNETAVLELFHGPTSAFKDVGARFLAECSQYFSNKNERTVLVATSGDTGGAVAAAFYKKPKINVVILFPKGRISARQEKQLTAWGENVKAFSVRGSFDDCQSMVKAALADPELKSRKNFISANSVNIGRLLPQMTYYAKSSLEYFQAKGRVPGFIIPTGNLGNAVAAMWAKRIGFPIGKIVLATNANDSILRFFASGNWEPQPTKSTLANAMDVGNPSNMERLRHLYPSFTEMKQDLDVISVSDSEITETIRSGLKCWGEIWCPHTATAIHAREKLGGKDWVIVSTAHPAKFESIVEPLVGQQIQLPAALAEILTRESSCEEIVANADSLQKIF